jgi:hypothetical protein
VIADVVNYAIAGIGFIHALGSLVRQQGSHSQHEHCYDAKLD